MNIQINLTQYKTKSKKPKFFLTKKQLKSINKKNAYSNKIGQAALLHGYEEHKIKKWEIRHPKPTELQLRNDLFPEELKLAWEAGRDIALQHIRSMLIEKYCHVKQKEDRWHDVAVYKNEYTGELYNYPHIDPHLCGRIDQSTDSIKVFTSLRNKFLNLKKSGNNIVKMHLYDNNGVIRYTCVA